MVRSSDDTMHNVHYKAHRNGAANFGMTKPGARKDVTFAAPEFVRVKCDVHPWMTAYVGVFENPFFADLGADPAKADYILNISNDEWFDGSIGPSQHAHHALLRAVGASKRQVLGSVMLEALGVAAGFEDREVPAQIRMLVGERLFDRSSKDGTLTEAGRVLRDYAERLQRLSEEAQWSLRELRDVLLAAGGAPEGACARHVAALGGGI